MMKKDEEKKVQMMLNPSTQNNSNPQLLFQLLKLQP